jgi:hypothetical protein
MKHPIVYTCVTPDGGMRMSLSPTCPVDEIGSGGDEADARVVYAGRSCVSGHCMGCRVRLTWCASCRSAPFNDRNSGDDVGNDAAALAWLLDGEVRR